MLIWRITAIVSFIMFIVLVILLAIFKFKKNIYYKSYEPDELYDSKECYNTFNKYYLVLNESKKYISKYMLRASVYEKSVAVSFTRPYKSISYFVMCYDKKKRVVDTVLVNETDTKNSSKIIAVSPLTKEVNIIIQRVEGVEINTNVIVPLTKKKILLSSILTSSAIFTFLYALRHLVIELVLGAYVKPYLMSGWNIISILIVLAVALIYLASSLIGLRIKNAKNSKGGAVEYEFY